MFEIELDIFSGLPNPTWTLDSTASADLLRMVIDNPRQISAVNGSPLGLGYHGYILTASGETAIQLAASGLPSMFRISSLPQAAGRTEEDALVQLRAAPLSTDDDTAVASEPAMNELDGLYGRSLTGTCSLNYTDSNDFSFWNGGRRLKSNCYCYAANYSPGHLGVPGRKGGRGLLRGGRTIAEADRPSGAYFTDCMEADGWSLECTGGSLRVVGLLGLVIDPYGYRYWDMHFYRKNLNDNDQIRWCHKPGTTAATNKDASGNVITSVADADREFWVGSWFYRYGQIVDTYFSPPGTHVVYID